MTITKEVKLDFETWTKGTDKLYMFSTAEQALQLIKHLGWKDSRDFMDNVLLANLENQFAVLGWNYPESISWNQFTVLCKDKWLEVDGDSIYLGDFTISEFIEILHRNLKGFISDQVRSSHNPDGFTLTIGNRDLEFNNKFQLMESGSRVFK